MEGGKIRVPFVDIFDTALATSDDRPVQKREYIYASELGQGFYDRYHSMQGRPYTNPPNHIAIRKFKMGAMVEDFFKLCLYKCGLLIAEEERVVCDKYEMHVSGRLDIRYGGKISIRDTDFSEFKFLSFFNFLSTALLDYIEKFPNIEISECLIEVKSCSDLVFNKIIESGEAQEHHRLQGFHYSHQKQLPLNIVYLDKNNGRIASYWVEPNDPYLLRLYRDDIEKMNFYIMEGIVPDKEKPILFDGKKLSTNWKVMYSKYLSDYGYDTKEAFKAHYEKDIISYNRVLKRFWDGDKMTDDNKKKLFEMIKLGVDFPREITNVLKPQKEDVKTKTVTDYFCDSDTKQVGDRRVEIEIKVPTKKVSALDKLKGL